MATKQQLDELQVGGGATGVSMVPDAGTKKTTLPNSKQQGDMNPQAINADQNGQQETDPQNNTAPTGDMSAQNKASVAMKEHIDAMFNGEDLSEEFKEKATTIFEAAIHARINEEVERLEEQYAAQVEEAVGEIAEEITSKLDDYLNYCVEQWMKENEVAIEHSLKSEITEDFMDGLKNLFAENYIEIPEDKLNVLEQLTAKVEELEDKLNSQISENIELSKSISQYNVQEIFAEVSEGLVMTQVEKLRQLAEGIDYDSVDNYKKKLLLVKENYFPSQQAAYSTTEEDNAIGNNDLAEENVVRFQDPSVKRYFSAISRITKP
jgi:BMFP domain-containing protein YqiC